MWDVVVVSKVYATPQTRLSVLKLQQIYLAKICQTEKLATETEVVFWFIGVIKKYIKTYFKMSKQSERKFCIYIKTFYVGTQSFTTKVIFS
jgi:hypothetical protein